MKKILYIIPGLGSDCAEKSYKNLTIALENLGYEVKPINPNWYEPLSNQIFKIEKDAIVFGFSMGAILAHLIAEKFPCKKVILASISPIEEFTIEEYAKDLLPYMSKEKAILIAKDVKKITLKKLTVPSVSISGEYENTKSDFVVPKTGHRLSPAYIKVILSTLNS